MWVMSGPVPVFMCLVQGCVCSSVRVYIVMFHAGRSMRSLVGIGFNVDGIGDGIVCVFGLIVIGIRGGTVNGGVINVFVMKDRSIVRVIVKREHTVFNNACIQT